MATGILPRITGIIDPSRSKLLHPRIVAHLRTNRFLPDIQPFRRPPAPFQLDYSSSLTYVAAHTSLL